MSFLEKAPKDRPQPRQEDTYVVAGDRVAEVDIQSPKR
jgi:hypothetical protein